MSTSRLRPVLLEVLAPMPAELFHCLTCERLFDLAGLGASVHQEMRATYPPEMLEEARLVAVWLQDLSARYGERIRIRVVDPQSPQGLIKSLRYRVRRYPAFIVDRRERHIGWDRAPLEELLQRRMAAASPDQERTEGRSSLKPKLRATIRRAVRAAGEILYGMTVYDWVRDLRRGRGEIERLFVLITFGDLVGLPILPPYYTLRLLPYVVPTVHRWKRSILRERDWTDLTELIEGID